MKTEAKIKELSKALIDGEHCTLTGHLIDCDNNLGRSTIIDLNAIAPNNIRQVDHRTIDFIIFKNVKYVLGRKPTGFAEELPLKVDKKDPRWDINKLAVGNWFSQVNYYKLLELCDKDSVKVCTLTDNKELTLSKDIMLREMHNGSAFSKTSKITRSEMVEKLLDAKESVMSIKFHKKVDDKYVREILEQQITSQKQLNNEKQVMDVARMLADGEDVEMVCKLTS